MFSLWNTIRQARTDNLASRKSTKPYKARITLLQLSVNRQTVSRLCCGNPTGRNDDLSTRHSLSLWLATPPRTYIRHDILVKHPTRSPFCLGRRYSITLRFQTSVLHIIHRIFRRPCVPCGTCRHLDNKLFASQFLF